MNLAHPHFAEPRWLWLAALGPLVLIFLHRYAAWSARPPIGAIGGASFSGTTDSLA